MKSTDHNINNPLKTINIEMLRHVESWELPVVLSITQEEYNLIQIHDPFTIYHIIDSKDHRMYLGDTLIENDYTINKYFIGTGNHNGEYILYRNDKRNRLDHDLMIPICTYDNIQIAINDMNRFNNIGSHNKCNIDVYNAIKSYIDKDISTHELLIGFLTIFNYTNDPKLQEVIEHAITYNANKCQFEFPSFYSEQLPRFRDQYPNSLMALYSNLYDLMVKYDFFRDSKYHVDLDKLNLSKEIHDVFEIIMFF